MSQRKRDSVSSALGKPRGSISSTLGKPRDSISSTLGRNRESITSIRRFSDKRGSISVQRRTSDGSAVFTQIILKKRTNEELEKFKKELDTDDHLLTLEELAKKYATNLKTGLTTERAVTLLKENGPNCLVPCAQKTVLSVFLENLFGGLAFLLWIAVVLSAIGYGLEFKENPDDPAKDNLYLCVILLLLIFSSGTFGFYQEYKNMSLMEGFKNMIPKFATVIRDGTSKILPSEELVLGDIVEIEGGNCIPADIRILEGSGLKVDNSSITGESELQHRSPECTDKHPLETQNLAFFGTNVAEGCGVGIVVACGDDTLMGHIAGLAYGIEEEETLIKIEIRHFVNIIAIIGVTIGVFFLIASILIGDSVLQAFIYIIAIVIANVPEGMLITLTACLTLTGKRLAKKNCLVKRLPVIESLGSTSIICSDKTGTLTMNRMTVVHTFFDSEIHDMLATSRKFNQTTQGFTELCRVGMLCSRADFKPGQEDVAIPRREVSGDASESAVLKCMEVEIGSVKTYRSNYPKVFEIPFNSTNKYQASIHRCPDREGYLLVMKGAPERIIDKCSMMQLSGKDIEMSERDKQNLRIACMELGYLGERVLAFCDTFLPADMYPPNYEFDVGKANFPMEGLRFVGFMSMIDPPKANVPEAIAKCHSSGIRVIMVTGDHPITAMSIARKVGIISQDEETAYDIALKRKISYNQLTKADVEHCSAVVITGAELAMMGQQKVDFILQHKREIVFARTSPQQKLLIVEACQRLGAIVAVTGDGVNDSPALKKANIGIAMGITGSDVSKDAADMILLDDNFASIVDGIEEGRLIFDNLKKSIRYIMTTKIPEIIPLLLYVVAQLPMPLHILAILCIDVGTDLSPAMSLAYEPPEADIMKFPPRNPQKDTLTNMRLMCFCYLHMGVMQTFAAFSGYFFIMASYGWLPFQLFGIRDVWQGEQINDLMDSYGQEWTYADRRLMGFKAVAAYFLCLVFIKWFDLFAAKTRRASLKKQGLFSNKALLGGMAVETIMALFFVYCPGLNSMLQMDPIDFVHWLPALPFAILLIAYEEFRKHQIRRHPGGFFERETYY